MADWLTLPASFHWILPRILHSFDIDTLLLIVIAASWLSCTWPQYWLDADSWPLLPARWAGCLARWDTKAGDADTPAISWYARLRCHAGWYWWCHCPVLLHRLSADTCWYTIHYDITYMITHITLTYLCLVISHCWCLIIRYSHYWYWYYTLIRHILILAIGHYYTIFSIIYFLPRFHLALRHIIISFSHCYHFSEYYYYYVTFTSFRLLLASPHFITMLPDYYVVLLVIDYIIFIISLAAAAMMPLHAATPPKMMPMPPLFHWYIFIIITLDVSLILLIRAAAYARFFSTGQAD